LQEEILKKSVALCKHLSPLLEIGCRVLDLAAPQSFGSDGEESSFCDRCAYSEKTKIKPHLYGLHEAFRWQGKYLYYCPIGLLYGAFALLEGENKLAGGIIVGPMVMGEMADTLMDISSPELEAQIRNLPVFSTAQVSHLCEAMSVIAEGLSGSSFNSSETAPLFNQQDYLNAIYEVKDKFKYQTERVYPIELETRLLERIKKGEKAEAQQVLNELLGHIYFYSHFNLDGIQARVMELLALLSRAAISSGADVGEIFRYSTGYIRKMESFESIDELSIWLSGIMHRFMDLLFDYRQIKHSDLVFRVMEYIRVHFNEKLNLDDLAKHVCLSKSYLSSIFKKETGMSISMYINKVRVENSKRMLRDTTLSLAYIAGECCFDDQSYFSKVFKAHTGMSPKKYRDSFCK